MKTQALGWTVLTASLLAAAVVSPRGASAQEDRPRCRFFCGISIENVAYLGDSQNAVIDGGIVAEQLKNGDFWVTHRSAGHEVIRFNGSGEYLGTFGTFGQGPEEYLRIGGIVADGENVWIVDDGNQRLSVLDSLGASISRRPARFQTSTRQLRRHPDGDLVFSGSVRSPDRVGYSLHKWDPDNGSFAWSGAPVDGPITGSAATVAVAVADDGTIYAAPYLDTYTITHFGRDGEVISTVSPNRKWHSDWQVEPDQGEPDGRPRPARPTARIFALHVIEDRLVVLGATGDSDWPSSRPSGYLDGGRLYDSVVDVYDRHTLELIASRTWDLEREFLVGFTATGLIYSWRTGEAFDHVGIWRIKVR